MLFRRLRVDFAGHLTDGAGELLGRLGPGHRIFLREHEGRHAGDALLGRLLRLLGKSDTRQSKIEIDIAKSLTPRLEAGKLYFLPSFYAP